MMIQFHWVWMMPIAPTVLLLGMMFRPLENGGGIFAGIDFVFRAFWLMPILAIWMVFFFFMWVAG
jgi:hypothetical protein